MVSFTPPPVDRKKKKSSGGGEAEEEEEEVRQGCHVMLIRGHVTVTGEPEPGV